MSCASAPGRPSRGRADTPTRRLAADRGRSALGPARPGPVHAPRVRSADPHRLPRRSRAPPCPVAVLDEIESDIDFEERCQGLLRRAEWPAGWSRVMLAPGAGHHRRATAQLWPSASTTTGIFVRCPAQPVPEPPTAGPDPVLTAGRDLLDCCGDVGPEVINPLAALRAGLAAGLARAARVVRIDGGRDELDLFDRVASTANHPSPVSLGGNVRGAAIDLRLLEGGA